MAAAASTVTTFLQYSVATPDQRTPWLPTDEHAFRVGKEAYPSPYPKDHQPSVVFGSDNHISSAQAAINVSGSIVHSIETTRCTAATYINISNGSIILGDNVVLQAPVVRIHDDGESAIRTSVIARKSLSIEADILIINRADIFPPEKVSLSVKEIEFANSTPNTAIFINSLPPKDADAAAGSSATAV